MTHDISRMVRHWATLLFALICIAPTSCSKMQDADSSSQSSSPTEVEFVNGQFSLTMPDGWERRPDLLEDSDADICIASRIEDAVCQVLTEPKIDFEHGTTLAQFGELTRSHTKEFLKDAALSNSQEFQIGEYPAIRVVITGSSESVRLQYWHTVVETPDHFHQLVLWSSPSRFDSHVDAFDSIMMSFEANH